MPSKPVTCTDVLDATTDKSLTKQVYSWCQGTQNRFDEQYC
jgi:hypothetical protein